MKIKYWTLLLLALLLVSFPYSDAESEVRIKLGNELLIPKHHELIDGKRVGIITNQTGVDSMGNHIIDILEEYPEVTLTAIFVPEHGLDGKAKAGEYVESYMHPNLSIPVFSLYGKTRMPTEDMMKTVDVLLYDIQDIGARSYTYISTLNYCMIAAQKYGKEIIVLDRPNPLGGEIVDGPVLEEGFQTFVGVDRLPMAHGMTVGELAQFFNRTIHAKLTVVPMEGYKRSMLFEETGLVWIPSSLNIPDLQSLKGYMATGLGEGTGIVQKDKFKWIGGKGIDSIQYAKLLNETKLPGVQFIPEVKEGYGGVRLDITDPYTFNPAKTGIYALAIANQLGSFEIPKSTYDLVMFDKIMGTSKIGENLRQKLSPLEIEKNYQAELNRFKEERKPYLIYDQENVLPAEPQVKKVSLQGGFFMENKNYVPIRPVVEALGFTVGWDASARKVLITGPEKQLALQPGTDINPTAHGFIKAGTTYIPVDLIKTLAPHIETQGEANQVTMTAPLLELTVSTVPYVPVPPVVPNGKIVYLTFDDGPSKLTPQVLDILKEYDVKATFFLLGRNVAKHAAIVKRMQAEGHSIGGHTYSHDYGKIYRDPKAFFADLDKGYEAIAKVTGVKPTIFRFPGGSNNQVSKKAQNPKLYSSNQWIMKDLVKQTVERGDLYFDWNASSGDASGTRYTVQSAVANMIAGAKKHKEVVILNHDTETKINTVRALPEVIEYLKKEGYTFGTLDRSVTGFAFLK